MNSELKDVTGFRGERIVEICLTEFVGNSAPLFRPAFLGDKWPAIDFLVELIGAQNRRPYFFAQVKATTATLSEHATNLRISSNRNDIERLLQIPGPTYIFGVHAPSQRVFVRSIHTGTAIRAVTRISISHELTRNDLQKLYNEVRDYWLTTDHKPATSVFA